MPKRLFPSPFDCSKLAIPALPDSEARVDKIATTTAASTANF
jgi:hypothetical protein